MRRSRPPQYRGKSIGGKPASNGRKNWRKQKLLGILHFRGQTEEELIAPAFASLTTEWEFVTEDSIQGSDVTSTFLFTEDNYTLIAEQI